MSEPNVAAFVIHLQRAERRRPQVDRLRSTLPMETQIIEGVDGRTLPDADAASVYRRRLASPAYPFDLLRTEIACFLSHRRAWQAIVDGGLDSGLVLEDDVAPEEPLFSQVCGFVMRTMRTGDYVRLPYRGHTDGGPAIAAEGNLALVTPRLPGTGMQAQLVGRDAAAALLRATETFDRPVDAVLQLDRVSGVRILAARPVCIRQIGDQLGGSVVQKKDKSLTEVLDREVRRAWYRLAVRLRSLTRTAAP